INLPAYASDSPHIRGGKTDFRELLERILDASPPPGASSARLRLSSLEPEAITPQLARVLAHPRVCPHFHLPLQSGSDAVLKAMARRATRGDAAKAAALLRGARSGAFIAADLITGFPGETDEDHAMTESLVRELEPASLHVFPFSRRPGTPAWDMRPRVPERIARARARSLRDLSRELWQRYADRLAGSLLQVIVEKNTAAGWEGLSENYMTVRGTHEEVPLVPGDLVRVRITGAGEGFVTGEREG
ncbi:MAG: radical SAM protein, partial [Spirochaetaceae bacterium]|nr:radical SAM protein [Spirochaetaceae bacterium]